MTLSNTHSVPSATKSVSMPYLKPLTVHSVHFNPAGNINQTYTSSFHTPDKTFQIVMITRQCVSVCGFVCVWIRAYLAPETALKQIPKFQLVAQQLVYWTVNSRQTHPRKGSSLHLIRKPIRTTTHNVGLTFRQHCDWIQLNFLKMDMPCLLEFQQRDF